MSSIEVLACRNPVWRSFTGRVVVPWVFGGHRLEGEVLELGSGAGANAAALLERYPHIRLTATDLDPRMLESARRRLEPYSERVTIRPGDAVALDFEDRSFDAVVSMIMLHHVGDWEAALSEVARVLRPGGSLVGYDLARRAPAGWLQRRGGHRGSHDMISAGHLRARLTDAGLVNVCVAPGLGGFVSRFSAQRDPGR